VQKKGKPAWLYTVLINTEGMLGCTPSYDQGIVLRGEGVAEVNRNIHALSGSYGLDGIHKLTKMLGAQEASKQLAAHGVNGFVEDLDRGNGNLYRSKGIPVIGFEIAVFNPANIEILDSRSISDERLQRNPSSQLLTVRNWKRIADKVTHGLHIEGASGTRRKRTVYITRYIDPYNVIPDAWRVSCFIRNRPFGHQYFRTKEDAIRSLVSSTQGSLGSGSWVYDDTTSYSFGEGRDFKSYNVKHPLKIIEIA